MYRMISRRLILLGLTVFLVASPALGSHFRGGNVNAQVTADGVATLTYEALWRKGNAFFPFDGIDVVRLYDPANTSRTSPLRTVFANIGDTTVFRDVSDPAFDFRIQVIDIDLASLGLPQGSYVARFEDCCRIRGIQNAPESTYSLETLIIYDGTDNGSPILNSRILTVVGKGLPYDQNLNAFDPDGRPLTYQWLIGSGHPTRGPTFNVPGITLDGAGQIFISPSDTANLVDFNPFNPAGDYVFKVRVTDADGAFSDRDVLLDVVATANQPPEIAPIGNRVIEVGESLVLPITAIDPNVVDTVTLDTSVLPDNTILVRTPGNPASGTLAFRPDAGQVGVFGINVEAADDGTPILTDSELVTITVLDPANGCPVLSPLGNFDLTPGESLSFALVGADPDAGQSLSYAAAFLPPGATFDPATATFSWTPTAADAGVHLGTVFEVRDSSLPPCSDRETVGFSVQPSNRFPVLDPIGEHTVTEGTMVFFTVSGSDPDGDALTFSAQPLPTGATFDPATRELMWTPTIGQAGTYEITFRATDAGTPSLGDSETVRVTVAPDGGEAIRLIGVAEEQVVAGRILVEARVVSPFEITSVTFAIDGVEINADPSVPYFLGGELDGLPLGFDTLSLADGLHVIEATALDSAGQTNTTQRKIVVRNFVPPVVDDVDGLFDGAVTSGTIAVEVEASDDQQVASVEFLIDGESVNNETGVRYFLGGGRLPEGTFDVSCTVCLQAGDRDDDLVVVAVDEDGTLAALCAVDNLTGVAFKGNGNGNGTPDGDPPADEDVCDVFRGVNGPAFGLCNAFCEAQDCDGPGYRETPCEQLRQNFIERTGEGRFPCEAGGECIQALTLGWVEDPSRLATFGPEDFNGAQTRFQLPFEVPLGFDTTALQNGTHTLTVIVTDNTGLETVVEIVFLVDNAPPPPDALKVTIVEPVTGTIEAGRVLPFATAVADAQGPVTVRFYADSDLLIEDAAAPFATTVLVPGGTSDLVLQAIAEDDRGPRAAVPVVLTVVPRPVDPPEVLVVSIRPENALDGLVPLDTRLFITLSDDVDPASITEAVELESGGASLPIDVFLGDDPRTVIAEPLSPLEADTLYAVVVDGLASTGGGRAPRRTARFLTDPGIATVVGFIGNTDFEPLPGVSVNLEGVTGETDAEGRFRLVDVPTGLQFLHVHGTTLDGVTFPSLAFQVEVVAGLRESPISQPIVLPALDITGGLDVVGGVATGGGVLTSSQLPGMALDLNGVSVSNPDGTPFTGRMSISLVQDDAVPMELPLAVVSSETVITVQPPNLHFDPPAPITYPALDSALPGETVALWHFDHDLGDWFNYGTGTVTADGLLIVSDPGQGLPKTGWGSPAPPWTTTTVTGRVFDSDPESPPDGNDLHGCRVTVGTRSDISGANGLFRIDNVGAGRQGSPINLRVTAACVDIFGSFYFGHKTVRAVQDGTTQVSLLQVAGYAPLINNRLFLHGDFQNRRGERHVLSTGSSHAGERRYQSEVKALRKLLRQRGFRQDGSIFNRGMLLEATGPFDANVRQVVRLFNTLEFEDGGATGGLGNDEYVGPNTNRRLNEAPPILWGNMAQFGGTDYGCSDAGRPEPGDGYGSADAGILLQRLPAAAINDISIPAGGPMPKHGSHQTGIDVDISLPNSNPASDCPNTAGWGQIDVNSADYARDDMRTLLRRVIDTGMSVRRWLNDPVLSGETWMGQRLCTFAAGHADHLHVRIRPTLVPAGARGTLLLADLMADKAVGDGPLRVFVQGAGNDDVPVDAGLEAVLSEPFDPATLNAATVVLSGPQGDVQADVLVKSAQDLSLRPVAPLDFATTYTLTVNTGAVLADGTLLPQPLIRTFTTEATPSLRVLGPWPAEMSELVPIDVEVQIKFDGAVDPRSLTPGAVTLRDERQGTAVAVATSLIDDRKSLALKPLAPLAELTFHTLSIAPTVRGADGSPLVSTSRIGSFATGLRPGLEQVTVTPDEIVFSRADLAERSLTVTGFFADGSTRDLSSPIDGGTDYGVDKPLLIRVDADGVILPLDNGSALLDVVPLLEGFQKTIRVDVDGVFPEISFLGRQFDLGTEEPVTIAFSEPIDSGILGVASVAVADIDGNPVAGSLSIAVDGLSFTFEPFQPLQPRTDYRLTFDLLITDDLGVTRPFPRRFPFATAAENFGFELGDLTGFDTEGDVEVVASFGPLVAPEGDFMAKMTNSELAVGGEFSRLSAVDLTVPEEAQLLVFTYNFLTDEIEQGNPFNDFFRAVLVLEDGSEQTIVQVTRDNLRFSGQTSPVPGFDRMTGFRTASIDVGTLAAGGCHLIIEMVVTDAGDGSIDSAVLLDDIHFE